MKLWSSYQRASISVMLAIAIMMVFTLRSFAAPEISKVLVDPVLVQDCTGTLSVKSGQITINGNVAQTGATVMSGSTIATGSSAKAVIDMGPLGRVEIGEATTVTIICVGGALQIRSSCTKTEVEVTSGTLNVTAPTTATLGAGQDADYNGGIEATSSGAIDVKVECEGSKTGAGPFVGAGLLGLLALIGVGAAVWIGIAVGDEEGVSPTSPIS
jgi:hypothetical protein